MAIRKAAKEDVGDILRLLGEKRARLASYEPVMWRAAPEAAKISEMFLSYLVEQEATLAFVAEASGEVCGFIIAQLQASPPVYTPGGSTCFIDDFAVENSEAGRRAASSLLHHAWTEAKARGAVQTLIVGAEKDAAIGELLRQEELHPASVWWTKTL